MVRKRSDNARALLTDKEYKEYKSQKDIPQRFKILRQIERNRPALKRLARDERYRRSTAGKIGKGFSSVIGVARRGITSSLYGQNQSNGIRRPTKSSGGRGRPKGTFDPRYARFGGVYGYRKYLAQQRWKERQQILEQSVTNPRQREVLNQIRARDEARMQSPERRTFPDTTGNIPVMRTIHSEINDYANLVG